MQASYDKVIRRFGPAFGSPYGWAAQHVRNPGPTTRPNFADIEKAVQSDHLRAHYQLASHKVHANPKGVFFSLGLSRETPLLLAGPSNVGLDEPGHRTAVSLLLVTTVLAGLAPSLHCNVVLHVLMQLTKDVGAEFGDANDRLAADEARLRAAEAASAKRPKRR